MALSTPPPGHDTDALRAQLAAADSRAAQLEEWLDVAYESSPVAMATVSIFENRFVRVNRAFEELVGYPRAHVLGVDPFAFVLQITHPDDLAADQQLLGELAVGARRDYHVEKRYVRPDGSIRWGLLYVGGAFAPPSDATQPVGPLRFVVTQVVDITEQKATEQALRRRDEELRHAQRIETIGRLAGGIAHDFNNLLTVILGHGEALRDLLGDRAGRPPAREAGDALESILGAAERAASLTAQLLAQGRRTSSAPRTFVLSEAVAAVQRLLVRVIGSNIMAEQKLGAAGAILADQGQVAQVVMNLVMNARDAMPEGGKLRIATRDVGDGEVALDVVDSGHGMDAAVQARIFEPFFTTREGRAGTQGTGLGLATVERIVREAGGRIEVESAVGAGTRVSVYFPRVAHAPPAEAAPLSGVAAAGGGRRVLVAEDDPAVRALVATVLAGAGYLVAAARDGEEALAAIDAGAQPFDLVVTDLMMPRLGGAALARRLRTSGSETRVLFISGYSDHTPSELAPYGTLLPKPFTPSQLVAAVRRALAPAA